MRQIAIITPEAAAPPEPDGARALALTTGGALDLPRAAPDLSAALAAWEPETQAPPLSVAQLEGLLAVLDWRAITPEEAQAEAARIASAYGWLATLSEDDLDLFLDTRAEEIAEWPLCVVEAALKGPQRITRRRETPPTVAALHTALKTAHAALVSLRERALLAVAAHALAERPGAAKHPRWPLALRTRNGRLAIQIIRGEARA